MANGHQKMGFHRPHKRVQIDCSGNSRTKQSFKKECDINEILRQFRRTGLISHVERQQGFYGDFIGATTYHDALNLIHDAQDMFMTVPAHIRAKFENDPAKFLDFVHDPDNIDEMRELGLLPKGTPKPKEEQKPAPAPNPPPAKNPPVAAPEPQPEAK